MTRRFPRISGLQPPEAVDPSVYFFSLLGPVVLTAALGFQLLMVALLAVQPPERNLSELSDWGILLTHPEWDILFYAGTVAVTVLATFFTVRLWNRRLRAAGRVSERFLIRQTLFQLALAGAATALLLHQFLQARVRPPGGLRIPPLSAGRAAVFTTIALVTLVAALFARTARGPAGPVDSFGYLDDETGPVRRRWWSVWDPIVPVLIVAFIYVTTWREVAGRQFLEETLLHWDYFAMGPALSFTHGFALGSEIHSAYGVGWPVVFSGLSKWLPLSFGRMIQVASIYTCLHFVGAYVFLRLMVKRPFLAAAGVVLAMLPYFVAMEGLVIWRVPNVTAMRWSFDIWCLIVMVMYARTGRRAWALAGGAIVGLAVFFVVDTGMELVAAFGFFWLCLLLYRPDKGRVLRELALVLLTALVVLLAGLAVAGRGDIFNAAFVKGWLEAPLEFGGGFGMLPVAIVGHPQTLIAFGVLFLAYITTAGYALGRAQHGEADPADRAFVLITGFLAFYGLMVLVKYMGHSAELIFYRLLMPAALLGTILVDRAAGHYVHYVRHSGTERARVALGLPVVAAGLLAVFLAAGPQSPVADAFLAYPNVISERLSGETPSRLCLITRPRDLCGIPESMAGMVDGVHQIVGRLEQIDRDGETFGVIDEAGAFFNAATGTAPWGRYSRIFATTPTKRLVNDVVENLEEEPPDYILTRSPVPTGPEAFGEWSNFGPGPAIGKNLTPDTWEALLDVVDRRYALESEVGPYQIWRLTDPG
ncbi:MAG TPA: hypothetical protein VFV09_03560 [Actinomycetota bacterium]|nr:hypothetical protein [Actinomycetota bacterium]